MRPPRFVLIAGLTLTWVDPDRWLVADQRGLTIERAPVGWFAHADGQAFVGPFVSLAETARWIAPIVAEMQLVT